MLLTIFQLSFPIIAVFTAYKAAMRYMAKTNNARKAVGRNLKTVLLMLAMFFAFSFVAAAAGEEAVGEAAAAASNNAGFGLIAAGLCTGLAGIGGGIALASGAPAAIGAVSEDPAAFGKALIFVALGETIALYGVVISVMILSKIPTL
ncbi:MAG: ATP synthase subunit C [Oscillospiraceae bacterium]|nr:ATP synthase subunit C [Oscillospiraceae bacterium]